MFLEIIVCMGLILGNAVLNLYILGEFLKFMTKRRAWIASLAVIGFSAIVGALWKGSPGIIGIGFVVLYFLLPVVRCVLFLKNEDYKDKSRVNYAYGAILLLFAIPCAYFLLMGIFSLLVNPGSVF